jgi:prepilin-type processing-associated H-X9-DG protein
MRLRLLLRSVPYLLVAVLLLAILAMILPMVMNARATSDRVACENHLRELGLIGVRNPTIPGESPPIRPRDELPPGTFLNPALTPEMRMSWYVYVLGALEQGVSNPNTTAKAQVPAGLADAMHAIDIHGSWDAEANKPLANYRLKDAICPAVFKQSESPIANYVAIGGIGLETPRLPPEEAGPRAGAYYYDGPTPDRLITDGLSQTGQIIETNRDVASWLYGGPATLRALDPEALPYLGRDRPFGGCHAGGCNLSLADGSVRFLKDTIEPPVFRALFTRAGGPNEMNPDGP